MEGYYIGQKKRADKIGLKGRTYLTWLKCKNCAAKRWVRPGYEKKYICVSCFHKKAIVDKKMNLVTHRDNCLCHRCRIGKGMFVGEKNPMWKGGIKKMKTGYIYQYVKPDSSFSCMAANGVGNNYVAQHRLIMAKHIGRPLLKSETVHHKNGIKDDNRIKNLELWSTKHHSGQRIADQIKWAIELLSSNNFKIIKNGKARRPKN